jgi:penicillin-binding protein 1A
VLDKVGPCVVKVNSWAIGCSEIPHSTPQQLILVEDMVAPGTFANQGVYTKPQFLSRIEDKSGVIIYEPIPESHDVLNKDIAFAIIKLLEGVIEEALETD